MTLNIPGTQLTDPVVGHVFLETIPIDDRFFEQDPRVENVSQTPKANNS